MKSLKDKMYNYEVTPPSQSWQIIATALDEVNNHAKQSLQKSNKKFYLSLAAAVVTIAVFSVFIGITSPAKKINEVVAVKSTKQNPHTPVDKITVPQTNKDEADLASQASAGKKLNDAASGTAIKKYITISGPQGQPVKISSKVASLIVSSDDQDPPNPVWNAKVNKWKDIMKANIFGPATANFLDIVDLTHALNNP